MKTVKVQDSGAKILSNDEVLAIAKRGSKNVTKIETDADVDSKNFFAGFFPKRADIGPHKEEGGYQLDRRYFSGWMDVQRLGTRRDYCRMVIPIGRPEDESFFACALAGTTGLTSVSYRTKSVKDGFRKGRDDYIRAIRGDGRDAYCRILKMEDGNFGPVCVVSEDKKFGEKDEMDSDPPDDIKTLLDFYTGCRMWLRFRDDMLDYMEKPLVLQTAGKVAVNEANPRPTITNGLYFNGKDQFIRLGDSKDLTFGNEGSFRSVRAFSVWVRFDEFTNNAHIFDFGDGAGKNNVFLGILGKGDADSSAGNEIRRPDKCQETTVPAKGSGAQLCEEFRPQDLFFMSKANTDEWDCKGFEVYPDPKKATAIQTRKLEPDDPGTPRSRATLLYEVWDSRLRKVQIKINRAIPKGAWTHIVITTKNMDAVRPELQVYVNGSLLYTLESGFLPQSQYTSKNYLGKSNWADQPGEYELRDELFNGSIFDFRMYNEALSETKVKRILQWGMDCLGLQP